MQFTLVKCPTVTVLLGRAWLLNDHKMPLELVEAGSQLLDILGMKAALEEGNILALFGKDICMESNKEGDGEGSKILTPKKLRITPFQWHAREQRRSPRKPVSTIRNIT